MRIEMLANITVESAHWSRLLRKKKGKNNHGNGCKVVTIVGTEEEDHILNADSKNWKLCCKRFTRFDFKCIYRKMQWR